MQDSSRASGAMSAQGSLGARRTLMRVMHRKSQGVVAVYEQDPAPAGTRSLIFETPRMCIRVEDFPAEWQRLSDEELIAVSRRHS